MKFKDKKTNQNFLTPEELHTIFQQIPLEARIELSGYIQEKSRRCRKSRRKNPVRM